MKRFLSSRSERLDPLGPKTDVSPETAIKIARFMEINKDPFADLVMRSSRRIVEQPQEIEKARLKKAKTPLTTSKPAY